MARTKPTATVRVKRPYTKGVSRVPKVHLLLQFLVAGGERATFLVRNVSQEFETQLDIVCLTDRHLHQFYLALLRKSQGAEPRVLWNPHMVEVEGLIKVRSYMLKQLPVSYTSSPLDLEV